MPEDLCCDLCRSPSWPVWAPRLPTVPQNPNSNQIESTHHPMSPPSPTLTLMDPRYNKFWSDHEQSPVSSRKIDVGNINSAANFAAVNTNVNIPDNKTFKIPNGTAPHSVKNNNNNVKKNNPLGSFRLSSFNGPLMLRKNMQNISVENGSKKTNSDNNVLVNKSKKISTNSITLRDSSKTYESIRKKNNSPVLSIANQARAVSSPDPLHRPDAPRASLLSATASQRLR